jgi:hypothetical protein
MPKGQLSSGVSDQKPSSLTTTFATRRRFSNAPLEKVYGDWPVSTDPAAHVKAISELFDSGATIVNIHSGQEDQKRVIEFYGKEVLPRIKHG